MKQLIKFKNCKYDTVDGPTEHNPVERLISYKIKISCISDATCVTQRSVFLEISIMQEPNLNTILTESYFPEFFVIV